MQRRARNIFTSAVLAITMTGGLAACTGESAPGGENESAPGDTPATEPAAPPGKYRTLPEPCGTLKDSTLKNLLPGAQAGPEDETGSPYGGKPGLTYDTDRRVGCNWKSSTTLGSHHLGIDLERVVSYDPSVSDDEQAELLYDERAGQAGIPSPDESAPEDDASSPESTPDTDATESGDKSDESADQGEGTQGEKGHQADGDGSTGEAGDKGDGKKDKEDGGPANESAPPSPPPEEDLSPRSLTGIGESAYIDDKPATADSGAHRDITLVFRSANVIATIEYDQWLTDKQQTPDSRELQKKAQYAAAELAREFDED